MQFSHLEIPSHSVCAFFRFAFRWSQTSAATLVHSYYCCCSGPVQVQVVIALWRPQVILFIKCCFVRTKLKNNGQCQSYFGFCWSCLDHAGATCSPLNCLAFGQPAAQHWEYETDWLAGFRCGVPVPSTSPAFQTEKVRMRNFGRLVTISENRHFHLTRSLQTSLASAWPCEAFYKAYGRSLQP